MLKHVVHLIANVAPFVTLCRVKLKLFDRNYFTGGRVRDVDVKILFVLPLKKRVGHDNANFIAQSKQGAGEQKTDESLSLTSSELENLPFNL